MKFYRPEPALTYNDVQLIQKRFPGVSRSTIDLSTKIGKHTFKLPIIAANMPTVCGEKMAIEMAELGGLGIVHRFMPIEDQLAISTRWKNNHVLCSQPLAHSLGMITTDRDRYHALVESDAADILCIDTAHGFQDPMADSIKYLRHLGFEGTIIAGNVCTHDGAAFLAAAGADVVKVGVGPGSVCTTRIKTGCGLPQLTALDDCNSFDIIADGGITEPGSAVKALALGAKAVMIGGMLAGTNCTPNWDPESTHIHYAGSASSHTKQEFGLVDNNAEGITKYIEAKPAGSTGKVIKYIIEGLRSGLSYNGSLNLSEHQANAEFVRVTPAGVVEATPHFSG